MRDNVCDLEAEHFTPHQKPLLRKAELQTRDYVGLGALLEVFFKVNILKRKSEVLTQQQKGVLKIDRLKCVVVWSGENGRPLLRTDCQQARLFHYTAQNNSRRPLK